MALAEVVLFTFAAGAAIPLGGLLAHVEHLRRGHFRDDLLFAVSAFGGGALLAAVVLILVPEGLEHTPPATAVAAFMVGAVGMLGVSYWMARRGTRGGQFAAMLTDFAPESIALGAAAARGSDGVVLLAVLIGLQNLPEGFAAYRETCTQLERKWRFGGLAVLVAAAFIGPLSGLGGIALAGSPALVGAIELAAAGGIFALIFQSIAPEAHRKGHVAPSLGAVAGFGLGLAGHIWLV